MFACIFCICFIEISFPLTDLTNYVTTSMFSLCTHESFVGHAACHNYVALVPIKIQCVKLLSIISFFLKHFQYTTKIIPYPSQCVPDLEEMTRVRND